MMCFQPHFIIFCLCFERTGPKFCSSFLPPPPSPTPFLFSQAKKFVEGVPQVVQKDVSKEEAERLKNALEAAGGTVEIE